MFRKTVIFLALCVILLSPVIAVNISNLERTQLTADYRLNPLSPEFIKFIKYNATSVPSQIDREGHRMGLIPSSIVLIDRPTEMRDFEYNDSKGTPSSLNETTSAILKSTEKYRVSPINPEFSRFIEEYNKKRASETDQEGHSLGLIPSPIDIGVLTSAGSSGTKQPLIDVVGSPASVTTFSSITTSSPSSWFDLRKTGKLTPVGEQSQCGACWAFSTFGSLESTNLPGTRWDFSENNMKNTHGFDLGSCVGGNYLMATAYLSRWSGAVSESSDPYMTTSSNSPGNVPVVQHVQDVIILPSRTGPQDNTQIKQMLQVYGALYSQIRWESSYYNKNSASYYYPGSSTMNHAIVIVGWDDSFSRTRFSTMPPGDGAFIVRNSWGDDWGESGYFYVSYYDPIIGRPAVQFFSEEPSNYDRVYQYDPLGWVTSVGVGGDSAWFANVFTSNQAEELEAVSFYTPVPNSVYQIEVYNDVISGPLGRTRSLLQTGSIPYAGYHTIDLSTSVPLQKGQKFSVVVNLITAGNSYPVAVEYPIKGYSSKASSRAGESWVSSDGASWSDLTTTLSNSNVCLKAFTQVKATGPTPVPTTIPSVGPTIPTTSTDRKSPTVSLISPKFMASCSPGEEIKIEWLAKDNVAVTSVLVEYSVNAGKNWISLLQHASATGTYTWKVPENLAGSFIIRVSASDAAGNTGSATRSVSIKSGVPSSRTLALTKERSLEVNQNDNLLSSAESANQEIAVTEYSRFDHKETAFIPAISRSSIPKGTFY
ncbi:MAG: lectin like domain-containing protein [Methanolinea sp.]|jgi:C1A family cysteine protease|nr:lectin like domain-containing protein [Methanolinea sp.]